MAHYKVVVNGFNTVTGDMKNIFYITGNGAPQVITMDTLMEKMYDPLSDHICSTFHILNCTYHLWDGPASGEWYDVVDGKKVPKDLPPWGVGLDLALTNEWIGAAVGDALPPQVAAYIYAKTDKPHCIAKKYYGSIAEASQANGVPTAGLAGALDTACDGWMTVLNPGLGSPDFSFESWGPIYGFQAIRSTTPGQYLGTQRRRKQGVGS